MRASARRSFPGANRSPITMQISLFPDRSLFAVLVIFIINYFVVRRFFLKPINDVLEAREHETKTADELYEQAMSRFNEATSHVEAKLHEAKREAAAVREHFRAEAAKHRAGLVERTIAEARRAIDEAEAKLKADVKAARERIVIEAESLARIAAERILGRAI
jgi:F-type H+-transporting ATPase subunit b